jgi:hypothetical protein
MARKGSVSLETLIPLGVERLARIVLDEAETNPSFRKRVTAALASIKGPDAVAKLIDRRLAALEGARAMIAWEKERAFAEDLRATVDTIAKELAPLSAVDAVQRLLRFIDTSGGVFERIDDSSGRIQDIYDDAAALIPDFVANLPPGEQAWVAEKLLVSLPKNGWGVAHDIAIGLAPVLPEAALAAWDKALRGNDSAGFLQIRQAIADARGDVDGFLALEALRPERSQNPVRAVSRRRMAGKRGSGASSSKRGSNVPSDERNVIRQTDRSVGRCRITLALIRPTLAVSAAILPWVPFSTG